MATERGQPRKRNLKPIHLSSAFRCRRGRVPDGSWIATFSYSRTYAQGIVSLRQYGTFLFCRWVKIQRLRTCYILWCGRVWGLRSRAAARVVARLRRWASIRAARCGRSPLVARPPATSARSAYVRTFRTHPAHCAPCGPASVARKAFAAAQSQARPSHVARARYQCSPR